MLSNTKHQDDALDVSARNRFHKNKEHFKALGIAPKAVIALTLFCQGRVVIESAVRGVCVVFTYADEYHQCMTRVYNMSTHRFDDVWGD